MKAIPFLITFFSTSFLFAGTFAISYKSSPNQHTMDFHKPQREQRPDLVFLSQDNHHGRKQQTKIKLFINSHNEVYGEVIKRKGHHYSKSAPIVRGHFDPYSGEITFKTSRDMDFHFIGYLDYDGIYARNQKKRHRENFELIRGNPAHFLEKETCQKRERTYKKEKYRDRNREYSLHSF